MSDNLKERQEAGMRVEKKMLEILLQWSPAEELRVRDITYIALTARSLAFDAMKEIEDARS